MHVHILGICGTFMGSLAILAKALGHRVTGSDANVYPPMSAQLTEQGIELSSGYLPSHLDPKPDCVIIGNALSRGNPAVEAVLEQGIPYTSGPQWLSDHVLQQRWVLAVAGTHGKTTTSTILAWILEHAGYSPGYLIGGVPKNFPSSASLGDSDFFVIEADEYDSAFFDKRSKFVHYRPRTLILNNLEYDHADIFPDLAAIQTQFHHLLRTVPGSGRVVAPEQDAALQSVIERGCWSDMEYFSSEGNTEKQGSASWFYQLVSKDVSVFDVYMDNTLQGRVNWSMSGAHNARNAIAAMAAARHVGVRPQDAIDALNAFDGVKRRMEHIATVRGVAVYDDFAHHPTAIRETLSGVVAKPQSGRVIAVIEPRSNTMKMGVHKDTLAASASAADSVYWYQGSGVDWSLQDQLGASANVFDSVEAIIERVQAEVNEGDQVIIMSNGGFEGIHQRLCEALDTKQS